jgi:uncharacterized protein YbaP (TraB family)
LGGKRALSRVRLFGLLLAAWLVIGIPAMAAETAWPRAWVVRDGDTEITLFGTVHALPKDTPWLSPALAARLDAADTLVLEALVPEDAAALAGVINKVGLRGDGKPMAGRLSPAELKRVEAAAAKAGVPMAALDRMETWLAALTLGNAALASAGINAEAGVEPQLLARARKGGKAITALETIEQQLRFFAGLPDADQRAMLMATVDEADSVGPAMATMVRMWKAGEVDAIAGEFDKEMQATPLLRQRLIVDRNARWADWIAGVMRRPGKVVVAVGAGHLGGADGLLARLAAKGLVPEPVVQLPTAPEPVVR